MSEAMHYRASPAAAPPRVIRDPMMMHRLVGALVLLVVGAGVSVSILAGSRTRTLLCVRAEASCVLTDAYGPLKQLTRVPWKEVRQLVIRADPRDARDGVGAGRRPLAALVLETARGDLWLSDWQDPSDGVMSRQLQDFEAFRDTPGAQGVRIGPPRAPTDRVARVALGVAVFFLTLIGRVVRFREVVVYPGARRLELRVRDARSIWRPRIARVLEMAAIDCVDAVLAEGPPPAESEVALVLRDGAREVLWKGRVAEVADRQVTALRAALAAPGA